MVRRKAKLLFKNVAKVLQRGISQIVEPLTIKDDFDNLIAKTAFKKHSIREDGVGLYVWMKK